MITNWKSNKEVINFKKDTIDFKCNNSNNKVNKIEKPKYIRIPKYFA